MVLLLALHAGRCRAVPLVVFLAPYAIQPTVLCFGLFISLAFVMFWSFVWVSELLTVQRYICYISCFAPSQRFSIDCLAYDFVHHFLSSVLFIHAVVSLAQQRLLVVSSDSWYRMDMWVDTGVPNL